MAAGKGDAARHSIFTPIETATEVAEPVNIFIAYSRADAAFLDELRRHLMPLSRAGRINVWFDGEIEAGKNWEAEIKQNLGRAEIIVLMVSADSIGSDYFYGKEVATALDRHESGTARVVPLIIRACQWTETPLRHLQALPKDGRPVANWQPRDDGWFDAAGAIGQIVSDIERERKAAVEAGFEKERRANQAEAARLEAIAQQEKRTKKAAEAAENQRFADEEEKKRKAAEAARARREREKAAETERLAPDVATQKPAATSEWKINFGVGAILVAILAVTGFLFFKVKACLSGKVNELTKIDRPGVAYPLKTDSSQLVIESPFLGGERLYLFAEVPTKPSFPGGEAGLNKFISNNLKYPVAALVKEIKGTVAVSFTVEKTGRVANVGTTSTLGGGCPAAAVRMVESMPDWSPGTLKNGRAVNTRMTLLVRFPPRD